MQKLIVPAFAGASMRWIQRPDASQSALVAR